MNLRDQANDLLKVLASELPAGLAPADADFSLDGNDEFFLTLEDRIVVMFYLEEELNSFILTLPIAKLGDGPLREEILLELMKANFAWNMTEGGTLGLDKTTNLICLSYLVPLPLDQPTQIATIVNKLASVQQHWERALKEMQGEGEGATGGGDSPDPMDMLSARA